LHNWNSHYNFLFYFDSTFELKLKKINGKSKLEREIKQDNNNDCGRREQKPFITGKEKD
jgi:hypothetical protein